MNSPFAQPAITDSPMDQRVAKADGQSAATDTVVASFDVHYRRYLDPKARTNKGVITWWGPVLAGDRLLVASTDERMLAISPYTGDLIGTMELSDKAALQPVVADGTVYIVTEDARLTALR